MLRAAAVTPNLTLGGAERWLVDLVKHTSLMGMAWTGVAVSGFGGADRHLASELGRYTTLYANKPTGFSRTLPFFWPAIHKVTGHNFREAVERAAEGADVIVTWGQPNMAFWFDRIKIPRVVCSHSTLREPACYPINGITHLAAVSEAAMEYFAGREGYEALPKHILYNGADAQRVLVRTAREEVRRGWGCGPRDIVIGYLGRQSEEKNPLAAAKLVACMPQRYKAVYYGRGPDGANFCPHLHAWCERHIPSRYRLCQPVPNVGDVLNAFDVLVLASHREAFSLTLIESWMAGTPVVATPVGSLPELEAKFGRLVFRVPPNPAIRELCAAVEAATTPRLRNLIVDRASKVAWQNFTIGAMARRWVDYLGKVATGELR